MIRLVPKKYKGLGLKVWCNECRAEQTQNNPCSHKIRWKYKILIQKNNKKFRKTCKSTELQDALHELYDYKKEIECCSKIPVNTVHTPSLRDGISRYLDSVFKRNEFQDEQENTSDYEKECLLVLERFHNSLEIEGYNPDVLLLTEINEKMLAPFYKHIKECGVKASATKDKHTRIMRAFLEFLTKRGMYSGPNLFKSIKTSGIESNPISITDDELDKILNSITKDNGWGLKGSNRKKNYYRDWLPSFILLARHTGLRREELFELSWSKLVTLPSGKKYFVVKDFKKSRQKKKEFFKPVPVTKKVNEVLNSLPSKSEGKVISTDFISVNSFKDFISRAFSHFYKVAVSGDKKKTFKQLRKSQMTDIRAILGDKAHLVSGHGSNVVLDNHYVDRLEMAIKMLELEEGKEGES